MINNDYKNFVDNLTKVLRHYFYKKFWIKVAYIESVKIISFKRTHECIAGNQ